MTGERHLAPARTDARPRRGHDVVTRAQLRAQGVPQRTITHRCHTGVWQSPLPGVVVLHSGPLTWRQRYRAALLYADGRRSLSTSAGRTSGDASLTGVAALALYRLRSVPPPDAVREVDVLVPERCGVASRDGVRLRRTQRMPRALLLEGRLPVAPLRRAAADAVRGGGEHSVDAPAVLHELVQTKRVAPDRLAGELQAAGVSWRTDVAAVLRDVGEGVRSPVEGLARCVVLRSDLPRPLWNLRLTLDADFLAVPDAYWPRHGVMLEVDSKEHHWAVADWEATMARHNRLTALGFRVLHASPRQFRDRPAGVLAAVRTALGTGPHGPLERVRVGG
ncbi:hypothetical protein RM572_12490 [Streptomyces sp. DSM 42041]|uniref:DUF559 domain-containing protein n=1 Tax=Streptomyces hazeniae TaxID=3075538 RepID=A0ABU2NRH3_9ACTN|nr:hypothetical protein [Streptomyces sp. DSM 42041]MDT0379584.1 hypothetical protein [Streptomyces sp. DSM 42041]